MLIIAIISVALCNRWIDFFQSPLHNIVHILNGNLFFIQRIRLFLGIAADKFHLILFEIIHNSGCGFVHCPHDFLNIKILFRTIFLNYIHHHFHLIHFKTLYLV